MLHHKKDPNAAGKIIGVGIIGAILGAVAGIFLSPKSGKENRDDLMQWSKELQEEITDRVKEAHTMNQERYEEMVDEISQRKRAMSKVTDEEWSSLVKELKKHWSRISKEWDESGK